MFKKLARSVRFTRKLGERAFNQEVLKQVLFSKIYDNLNWSFYQEESGAGERIPIFDRAPIVDVGLGLIRNTVDTTTSFVFGEGRFPDLDCEDDLIRDSLLDHIKEANLFEVMSNSMLWGSLGSAAVHVAVSSNNRIHYKVYPTQFLTPVWNPDEPDQLESVTERYIVTAQDLQELGYNITPVSPFDEYFFQRIWDDNEETWFQPWATSEDPKKFRPIKDKKRSVTHNLKMVPWVWMKNLKGGDDIDGSCTFTNAIKSCIELDYLLSQSDRGLKYMADPILALFGANDPEGEITKGPTTALTMDADGRAEILELKGTAHTTMLDQIKQLRESALEAMGGNRSSPDKLMAAQSGTALTMLWQPTIMLAGDLRNSYGEKGLLQLLNLVVKIGSTRQLRINGELIPLLDTDEPVTLKWPPYFEPTVQDLQSQASTMATLITNRMLSQKTAIKKLAKEYEILDVDEEIAQIRLEEALQDQREAALAAQIAVKTNQN